MRTRRGLVAFGLLSALLLFGISAVDSAAAAGAAGPADAAKHVHQLAPEHVDGHDDGAEHMAEDLVGTPMRVIEERTAANAARIQRETGLRPGTARTRASAVADPGKSGSWSPVVDTPVVPVFEAVLPERQGADLGFRRRQCGRVVSGSQLHACDGLESRR